MQHNQFLWYTIGYEITTPSPAAGGATPASHPPAGNREKSVGSGTPGRRPQKFGAAMVAGLSKKRLGGDSSPSKFRAPSATDRSTKETSSKDTFMQSSVFGLFHGPLDTRTYRAGNTPRVRRKVPCPPCVAGFAQHGVELSEARREGQREGRGGHTALEEPAVAAYKKTPETVRRISSFSTKAVFFRSHPSQGHGRREERDPYPARGRPLDKDIVHLRHCRLSRTEACQTLYPLLLR